MSGQWIDRVAILDLHRKCNGGGYGRIKVSLRTNSTNSAVDISAVWLYRYGFAVDQIAIVQNGNTGSQVWADIYLKCSAYARTTVYQVEGDRLWTLVSSSERQNTTTTDKKGSTEVYTAPGGARAGSKTVYGVDGAITLYSMLPYGFTTCSTNSTWGNTIGTTITSWNDSTGGSIDFRRDNPSGGKMSVKVNGRFYGNEGINPASLMTNANGYWGIGDPDGNSSNWIRTTTNGLIPVQSGGQGNGHSALGTSSWYFKEAFIDNINGTNLYLHGNQLWLYNLQEGNSDITDNTEILTSYASDNGFADSNAVGKVYKRDAIHLYNYIISKTDNFYVKKAGDTMTGNLSFSSIGDVATSAKISWNGSTDGADIYYQTTEADQGNLVLNTRDDANCYIRFAYNGAFKSYIRTSDGTYIGKLLGISEGSSWIDGQRYERGGFNLSNATTTTDYWPWLRQTNTSSARWFSFGTLGNCFYMIGSSTGRTDNGYDHGLCYDISNGNLSGINNIYTSSIYASNWFRSQGNSGWYSQNYGGGWYMIDSTWIRTYGNKNVYQNAGVIRTDGTFQVGDNGSKFYANSSGNGYFSNTLGIAGVNTNYKLYVNGSSLFNGNTYITNQGALIIYGDTVGNDASTLVSKTAGVLSYGDTGPKIDFGTSATGNQRGAIIFTDHDAAGAGVSWHFVSNQADWNVNSKRFVAKTSITIGQNLPNTNYNLYVNGSTYLNGILNVASTLQPTSTNTQTLGTSSLRWAKVYIGTADTYGSTTKGVYWNAGVPTAMTYELKSTVNNGTATRIAYYSGTNVVSSGSIVTDGSYLHNVSSLYVTKNDWVFDLGHNYTNQDAYLSADAGGIRIAFNTTNEGQTMTSIRPDSIYIGKKDSDGDFHDTITTDNASGSITMTGQLKVGDKVKLWTDSEGGNIDLIDNSSTRHYQIDAFNGNLRLYSQLYQNDSGLLRITLLDTNGNTTLNNIYTSTIYASNWFRSQGDSGWYNQNYDGGWYMSDSTWIRSFHNKSLYTGTGTIRSEREIQSTSIGGVCQFRAIGGAYGAMLRNDGADTWILLTNAWDQYGSWNGLRPFRINNGSGGVYIQTSLIYQHFTPVGNLYVGWNEGSSPALTASYGGTTASGSGNVITEARMRAAIANKHGSDRRVKQNIRDLSIQTIKKIYMNFKPVRYEFKQGALADKYAPGERFGYIAQDMESSFLKYGVNPGQLVYHQHNIDKTSKLYSYLGECNLYTIDYENLHALHTLMIQQHDSQIEQLKKQNKKLQQQIQLLNAKLDTLVVSHL